MGITVRAVQVLISQGGSRRGYLILSSLTKCLCFIVVSLSLSFVIPLVAWLHWPWHTDRSLHHTPIHVQYMLAAVHPVQCSAVQCSCCC